MEPNIVTEKRYTYITNFFEICNSTNQIYPRVVSFLLSQLGTEGSLTGDGKLRLKGRFEEKTVRDIFKLYFEHVDDPEMEKAFLAGEKYVVKK